MLEDEPRHRAECFPEQWHSLNRRNRIHEARYLPKGRIASEQFVTAKPGDGDFQSTLGSRLAHKISVDTVGGRLIHCLEYGIAFLHKILFRHPGRIVTSAILLGHLLGKRRFVVDSVLKFFEAERDGAEISVG